MNKVNLDEMRQASALHLASHRAQTGKIHETTPAGITPELRAFCAQLSASHPEVVPVRDDAHGLYGWCSDGVLE